MIINNTIQDGGRQDLMGHYTFAEEQVTIKSIEGESNKSEALVFALFEESHPTNHQYTSRQ